MENKIILDLCGGTGSWAKPYKDAGYDVRTITLPDFDVTKTYPFNKFLTDSLKNGSCLPNLHFAGESKTMNIAMKDVYGVLAAPPCTKFSKANWRVKKADRDFREGMKVVRACLEIIWCLQENGAPLKFWALENPQGYLYNFLGKPAFWFQPWQFGETDFKATKRTGIWGYFNQPAKTVRKRNVPFVRDPKKVKGGNLAWGTRSVEERAKTSEFFAKAFFKNNQ